LEVLAASQAYSILVSRMENSNFQQNKKQKVELTNNQGSKKR
jgi:hypothetical protein